MNTLPNLKTLLTWRNAGRVATAMGLIALAGGSHLLASPFGAAVGTATTETTGAATTVGAAIGGIVTVIGGGYTAWEAVHSRPFTTPLVCAIVGAVIAAVSVVA
jgi:hypothetical protein